MSVAVMNFSVECWKAIKYQMSRPHDKAFDEE